jgi:hypothetical protein
MVTGKDGDGARGEERRQVQRVQDDESEDVMPYQCCYCEKEFNGKNTYAIPEDYPTNKAHELKPLCGRCGGRETPTLDEICEKLDNDLRKKEPALWPPRSKASKKGERR